MHKNSSSNPSLEQKYDQLLGAISSGLAANRMLIDSRNTSTLLPVLSKPVSQLR